MFRLFGNPAKSEEIKRNPYDSEKMAAFYTRPKILYTTAVTHIAENLKLSQPFESALDIGCGTGISTVALKPIAQQIAGIDPTEHMLKYAIQDENVRYQQAAAESLPFPDQSFNLVTAFVAFHWVDQPRFLKEAARVLKDNGELIICNYDFIGIESKEYREWKDNVFSPKFPPLPGQRNYIANSHKTCEFPSTLQLNYPLITDMDLNDLVEIHMTYGGVFDAVNQNRDTPENVRKWLVEEFSTLLKDKNVVPFAWNTSIWCIQRVPRLQLIHAMPSNDSKVSHPEESLQVTHSPLRMGRQ